jgi:glycerol-3-phosphate dehydrogenase (NAD(P)+)
MNKNLSIIGAGAWGSALSIALADNFDTVYLHTHTKEEVTVCFCQFFSLLHPNHCGL